LQGLDQQGLADAAGLHRSYLSDIERGKSTEQTDRLFRVLRRLGLEVVVRPSGR
jgi:transcriptional regulator with XRE-family HTH domain